MAGQQHDQPLKLGDLLAARRSGSCVRLRNRARTAISRLGLNVEYSTLSGIGRLKHDSGLYIPLSCPKIKAYRDCAGYLSTVIWIFPGLLYNRANSYNSYFIRYYLEKPESLFYLSQIVP